MNEKKLIGTSLCILFAGWTLISGMSVMLEALNLNNNSIAGPLYMLADLVFAAVLIFLARKKEVYNNASGHVAAYALAAYYLIVLINCACSFFDYSLSNLLGPSTSLVLSIVSTSCLCWFIFSLKTWLPIKILVSLSSLLSIILGVVILSLINASIAERFGDAQYYISLNENLIILDLIINLALLTLAIVWMSKIEKPRPPQCPIYPNYHQQYQQLPGLQQPQNPYCQYQKQQQPSDNPTYNK